MSSLEQNILEALKPRGVRERIKLKFSKGFTASQILNRLPLKTQKELKENVMEKYTKDDKNKLNDILETFSNK